MIAPWPDVAADGSISRHPAARMAGGDPTLRATTALAQLKDAGFAWVEAPKVARPVVWMRLAVVSFARPYTDTKFSRHRQTGRLLEPGIHEPRTHLPFVGITPDVASNRYDPSPFDVAHPRGVRHGTVPRMFFNRNRLSWRRLAISAPRRLNSSLVADRADLGGASAENR